MSRSTLQRRWSTRRWIPTPTSSSALWWTPAWLGRSPSRSSPQVGVYYHTSAARSSSSCSSNSICSSSICSSSSWCTVYIFVFLQELSITTTTTYHCIYIRPLLLQNYYHYILRYSNFFPYTPIISQDSPYPWPRTPVQGRVIVPPLLMPVQQWRKQPSK